MRRARGCHLSALRCPCRPLHQRADRPPPGVHSEMRRARGWHHPDLRCSCRPLHMRADKFLAPLLRCDEQGGGTTLHCDVLVGSCVREQMDRLPVSILRCDEQVGGTMQPALRCLCRPLHQRADRPPPCARVEMRQTMGCNPALRCPRRTLHQRADRPPPGVHSQMRRAKEWHHPVLRCPRRPLDQREDRPPRGVHSALEARRTASCNC